MDVAGIHHSGGIPGAAHYNALGKRLAIRRYGWFAFLCLFTPLLRGKWDMFVGLANLRAVGPSGRAVLAVTDRPALNPIQAVDVCDQRHAAEHGEHDHAHNNQ